jgi:hypothetical protein
VRVPAEAGEGKAKFTLSYTAWKAGSIAPAKCEVAIARANAKPDATVKPGR